MTERPKNAFEWSKAYFQSGDRKLHRTRSVMAALMTYADFNTLVCWPSQETLAKVTGLSVDSVRRHLKLNVEAGWLKVLRVGSSVTSSSQYELAIPRDSLQGCKESGGLLAGLQQTPSSTARLTPGSTATLTTHRTTQGTTTRAAKAAKETTGLKRPDGSCSPSGGTRHVPTPSSTARSLYSGGSLDPFDEDEVPTESALAAEPNPDRRAELLGILSSEGDQNHYQLIHRIPPAVVNAAIKAGELEKYQDDDGRLMVRLS